MRAACDHGVPSGRIVRARFFGIRVCSSTDEITLPHKTCYVCRRAVVTLNERCVRLAGVSVSEDDTIPQRRMASKIDRADGALIHKENYFAGGTSERGPVTREDGLIERLMLSPNVIGRDHFLMRKYGADSRI